MPNETGRSDYLPLWWMGRVPIYATTVLVAAVVLGTVVTVMLKTAYVSVAPFEFNPRLFWTHGFVWQLVTHPLLNLPSFFYIFGLFFLYGFGIGVETYLGRNAFLRLLALLCLVPALTTTAWWLPTGISGSYWGEQNLAIGIFIAYATLYPNAEYWNWMTMKWLAFAGLALCSLMYFPTHDWFGLSILLAMSGAAHLFVRYERGHFALPDLRFWKRKPRFRVVRAEPAHERRRGGASDDLDALLDKIAKSGMASLTAKERARLEAARAELLKKDAR